MTLPQLRNQRLRLSVPPQIPLTTQSKCRAFDIPFDCWTALPAPKSQRRIDQKFPLYTAEPAYRHIETQLPDKAVPVPSTMLFRSPVSKFPCIHRQAAQLSAPSGIRDILPASVQTSSAVPLWSGKNPCPPAVLICGLGRFVSSVVPHVYAFFDMDLLYLIYYTLKTAP